METICLISATMLIMTCIILSIGIYQKNTNAVCLSKKRLDGKTALVTGGTAGMGLETAKDFAQRGARVIVACPFEDEGVRAVETITELSDNHNVVFKILDLASFKSTRNFATDILNTEERLDILINNAGVVGARTSLSSDGLHYLMQVNYFGAFLLTLLLLPLLKKTGRPGEPSRIVNIVSAALALGRVNFNKLDAFTIFTFLAYSNSKLYLMLFSRELTKRLQGSNVVINNVDPGAVGTNIFQTSNQYGSYFFTLLFLILCKHPWEGAQTALHVALDKKAGEVSGEFFKNCKHAKATRRAYDDKLAEKLFEESVRLVKLTNEELNQCLNIV